jgi:cobalt-zinc-cadmium efflux system outer membrane protein
VQTLVSIALEHRPDLAAYRLGISRAQAELGQERAERFSDAYFLYTPFQYRDNSQVDLLSSTSWGAGVFVSVPLFNRNQGNLSRARINIAQSQAEASAVERLVIAEVRQAVRNFEDTFEDAQRLAQTVLPAVQRKRDRVWRQYRSGAIDTDAFLSVQRDNAALVRYHRDTCARHRQNALRLNTAVGFRVLP